MLNRNFEDEIMGYWEQFTAEEVEVIENMQEHDRATGEYQCKCGKWINKPGMCDRCKNETEMKVEKYLIDREELNNE